jgi:pyruvate,water dikinase
VIEPLEAGTTPSLQRLGGKGAGLARLLQHGFPVPELWCLPADSNLEGASLEREIRTLAARLEGRFPEATWAVRSSATAEDLDDASFAGIYRTVLGVRGADALVAAVHACLASVDSAEARAYREARGMGHEVRMAVLIQRLLTPDVAGVMLTANPLRPFARECVIDAAYGLGEGVVSGRVDPDHLVIDRETGTLREQRIGEKATALRGDGTEGSVEVAVPAALRENGCLEKARRRKLFELARRVGDTLGPRMDLEWAFEGERLYLLQARPITGLPPERPREVWTRRFGDEYLAGYTTPIAFTFLVRWIVDWTFHDVARLTGRRDLLDLEPIRRYRGYLYASGAYTRAALRAVPRGAREGALRDWYTPLWCEQVASEPFEPLLLLRSIAVPLREPDARMGRNRAALAAHCARIEDDILPKLQQDYGSLSDAELRTQLTQVDRLGQNHFRVIRFGQGQWNPLFHGLLQGLLRAWAGDASGELYQLLVSGLPGTHTAAVNRDLWRLGLLARESPELRSGLLAGETAEALRARTTSASLWPAFDAFLRAHGHRSASREVSQPRWSETPELVLTFVRAQLRSPVPPRDPGELEAESQGRRREAEARARAAVGGRFLGAPRRALLRWVGRQAQLFTVYRENQRYHLDYLMAHVRQLLLEIGRRLEAAGVLAEPFEVFMLEADELERQLAEPAPSDALRAAIAERVAHYHRWKDRMPATHLFDGIETEGEQVEGDPSEAPPLQGDRLGVGASRGVVKARLRVVEDIASLDRIEPGEILVAQNIDPAWTGVFPILGGLITETGGLLSHGALLAREYGIPAVMGVPQATTRFATGMRAELDGTRGSVRVEAAE